MNDTIRHYIADQLLNVKDAVIGDDDDLLGTGLVDSVGMMSLVLFIEEEFGVSVPPEDVVIENFLSIRTIGAYVRGRRVP
jgi:acyl carrier protein